MTYTRRCKNCGKIYESQWSADVVPRVTCEECKAAYRAACGRQPEGHEYSMIYNDGETCLRCGHHRTISKRSVNQ